MTDQTKALRAASWYDDEHGDVVLLSDALDAIDEALATPPAGRYVPVTGDGTPIPVTEWVGGRPTMTDQTEALRAALKEVNNRLASIEATNRLLARLAEERTATPPAEGLDEWKWECAGCDRPVPPMGMCETCGVFGVMRLSEDQS